MNLKMKHLLLYIKKHLDNNYKPGYKANIELFMPYVPNAYG